MHIYLFSALADVTMDIYDLMELLGFIVRPLGGLAFGLGMGWLAVQAFKGRGWQLAVATILGLMASFVLLGRWVPSPGTLGGYGLGVGVGLMLWGMGRLSGKDVEE